MPHIRLPSYFPAVCAVASRHYRPDIYPMAMELAGNAAGNTLTGPSKSIAVIQAYLLLAIYPVPKRKSSQDRTVLLGCIALRYIHLHFYQPLIPIPSLTEWQLSSALTSQHRPVARSARFSIGQGYGSTVSVSTDCKLHNLARRL